MVNFLIRAENLLIFGLCLMAYYFHGASFWWFVLWILPDLGMFGYLKDNKFGALTYNLSHSYYFGFVTLLLGLFWQYNLIALGIIFLSHSALDRALGFGLKYPNGFKNTHIQKL